MRSIEGRLRRMERLAQQRGRGAPQTCVIVADARMPDAEIDAFLGHEFPVNDVLIITAIVGEDGPVLSPAIVSAPLGRTARVKVAGASA